MRILLALRIGLVFASELVPELPTGGCKKEVVTEDEFVLVEEIYDNYFDSLNNLKKTENEMIKEKRSLEMKLPEVEIPKATIRSRLLNVEPSRDKKQKRVLQNPFTRTKRGAKYINVEGKENTEEQKGEEIKLDEEKGKKKGQKKEKKRWKEKIAKRMKYERKSTSSDKLNNETEKLFKNKRNRNKNHMSTPTPPDGRVARIKIVKKDNKSDYEDDWNNKGEEIRRKEEMKRKKRRNKRTIKKEDECPTDEVEQKKKKKEWEKYFKGLPG